MENHTIEFINYLLRSLDDEYKAKNRDGVYGFTQRFFAYNSNKIEGNKLTEEQSYLLYELGLLPRIDGQYQARDIEEMNGHYMAFQELLDTFHLPLSQRIIKRYHEEFRKGIYEDRFNEDPIGEYRVTSDSTEIYESTEPEKIEYEVKQLLNWYVVQNKSLEVIAEFYARFISIGPFQNGSGPVARLILYRECLRNQLVPAVIQAINYDAYRAAMKEWRLKKRTEQLLELLKKEQENYMIQCEKYNASE